MTNKGICGYGIEIVGKGRDTVIAVRSTVMVTEIDKERIVVKTSAGPVSVIGTELTVALYEGRQVEIKGKINEVILGYEKKK